jgi:hypothetical protein
LTGGELTLAARILSAIRKVLRRPEPVEILRYRERMREEIRANLDWPERGVPEIVVVRLSKKDEYPSTDSPFFGLFGASPWFKFEVKRIHDRGLEVYASIQRVRIAKGRARTARPGDDDEGTQKVFVVGRIPYYSAPRFYVNYGWRWPYREVVLYEESGWGGPRGHRRRVPDADLMEIHDVEFQGESGNPWRWLRFTASRLRFTLADRREQKRLER